VPTIRHRAADALQQRALDAGADRAHLARGLDGVRPDVPGYDLARSALACAGWVDAALLWFSFRLRAGTP
jgi:hypothetical protein